jgi:hypothetical protein
MVRHYIHPSDSKCSSAGHSNSMAMEIVSIVTLQPVVIFYCIDSKIANFKSTRLMILDVTTNYTIG